jgi:rhamnose transport system permease protein
MTGQLFADHPGVALPIVLVLAIGLGAACGVFNGLLVAYGRVPALVVTLGTLYIFRGLAFLWTNGRQINAEKLPDSFLRIGTGSVLGIPTLALIALAVVLVIGQCLRDFRAARLHRVRALRGARRPRRLSLHRPLRDR